MSEIIAGALGAIIALIGTFIVLKFQYKDLYAKTISNERMIWLKEMRGFAGNLIVFLKSNSADVQKYNKLVTPILLRLNTNESCKTYDAALRDHLTNLQTAKANVNSIDKNFQSMFKDEWEKVKLEAEGITVKHSKKTNYVAYRMEKTDIVKMLFSFVFLSAAIVIVAILIWQELPKDYIKYRYCIIFFACMLWVLMVMRNSITLYKIFNLGKGCNMKKSILTKWWFWALIVFIIGAIIFQYYNN